MIALKYFPLLTLVTAFARKREPVTSSARDGEPDDEALVRDVEEESAQVADRRRRGPSPRG